MRVCSVAMARAMAVALVLAAGSWPISTPADTAAEHLSKGEALFAARDFSGAIHEYREAVRLKPRDPRAHFDLGLALKSKDDLARDPAKLDFELSWRMTLPGAL